MDPRTFDEAYALPIGQLAKYQDNMNVMSIRVVGGWTVAHVVARKRRFFKKGHKALELCTNSGWSVAHEQAAMGHVFDLKDSTLKRVNTSGITVAHIQASMGFVFPTRSSLCKLMSNKGSTVKDIMDQYAIDHTPVIVDGEKEELVITKKL